MPLLRATLSILAFAASLQVTTPPQTSGSVQGTVSHPKSLAGIEGVLIDVCLSPGRTSRLADGIRMPPRDQVGEIRISIGGSVEFRDKTGVVIAPPAECADPKTSTTDEKGRFVIRGLPAGEYSLRARRQGYVAPTAVGNPDNVISSFTITAGLPDVETSVNMVRGATISGRILDGTGRLAANVNVRADAMVNRNGVAAVQTVSTWQTDDRGEYRLFGLPPGEYFIAASSRVLTGTTNEPASRPPVRTNDTFYRDVLNITDATPVVVEEGEEVSSINLTLRTQTR